MKDNEIMLLPFIGRLVKLASKEIEASTESEGIYFGLTDEEIKEYEALVSNFKEMFESWQFERPNTEESK